MDYVQPGELIGTLGKSGNAASTPAHVHYGIITPIPYFWKAFGTTGTCNPPKRFNWRLMFWLDPTNATTTSWISSVVLELKGMGFKEVVLDDFCFPDSTQYIFNGNKDEALISAAGTLMSACTSEDFVLSFCVDNAAFPIPDGRSRLYLRNVGASAIDMYVSQTTFEEKDFRLVFLSETGDTRYDEYSVIRSMDVAEEVEARKAG